MDLKNINSISLNDTVITSSVSYEEFKQHNNSESVIPTIQVLKQLIFEQIYPVGSVYMNANKSANPSEILGFGEWQRIAGKYIRALGTSETAMTGGSDTITVAMLPSHNHSVNINTNSKGGHTHDLYCSGYDEESDGGNKNRFPTMKSNTSSAYLLTASYNGWNIEKSGDHTHNVSGNTGATGSGSKFMPTYQAFYVWQRVK